MTRQPTLRQLNYLVALARHYHFGHAARACHVTQSTLSTAIHELEEQLGIMLVERSNKRVLLTPAGEEVVRRSQQILTDVDDMVECCESLSGPFRGKLRLGVIPTIAPFLLPSLLAQLRNEHPDLKLFIREDLSAHLLDILSQGQLDLLLMALPYPTQRTEVMPLFRDDFLLACPPRHQLSQQAKLTTRDLQHQELLLLEDGHCLRDHALKACQLDRSDLSLPYQATSLNTLVQMVANGIGLTLLPEMAVDADILHGTDVRAIPIEGDQICRTIGLVWRSQSPREEEFRQFGAMIRERIDPSDWSDSADLA